MRQRGHSPAFALNYLQPFIEAGPLSAPRQSPGLYRASNIRSSLRSIQNLHDVIDSIETLFDAVLINLHLRIVHPMVTTFEL